MKQIEKLCYLLVAAKLVLAKKMKNFRNTNNIWIETKSKIYDQDGQTDCYYNFKYDQGIAIKKFKPNWNNFIIYWEKLEPPQNRIQQILATL